MIDISERRWRGTFKRDEALARHCTWRCGGRADAWFEPADRADLTAFIAAQPAASTLYWLGLGSNVLVRDGGVRGTVVSTSAGLTRHRWQDGEHLYAECGVTCARLAREGAARDRAGLEFLAGIPGTLGGALRMNAGALGAEIWEFVVWAELIDSDGQVRRYARDRFEIAYRHVRLPCPGWFVAALLHLPDSAGGQGAERIRQVLAQRSATQPTGKATCGSVFKNPPGDYAGRLIEQCGLKGHAVGGCHVSSVHANFIVNDDNASAADIEGLIHAVQQGVAAATGIVLEPEVQIIGSRLPAGAGEAGT